MTLALSITIALVAGSEASLDVQQRVRAWVASQDQTLSAPSDVRAEAR